MLGGYLVARALSLRIKRLERAARKVASGDFSDRIQPDSDDELGQLAAAFDDMQRQLQRLDRARKQFIAQASHELRTPIFSLGGFLELLDDEELDEDTRRQFLDQVRAQVERLRRLATELLDLSRLEAGALELRTEPTDVQQLAREVAGEFTPMAAQHDSELRVELGGEPIEIECDPERVAQVLRILLDNALLHTPAGTGVVVSAARENGQVRLEVSDSGLGIRRQTMPHIFEPFFTSYDRAQGAGLGLAIARELAERMSGELSVRSRARLDHLHAEAAGMRRLAGLLACAALLGGCGGGGDDAARDEDRHHQGAGARAVGGRRGRAPHELRPAPDLQGRGAGRRDRGVAVRQPGARLDHRRWRRRPGRRRLRLRRLPATARSPPTRTWSPPARATRSSARTSSTSSSPTATR